MIGWFARNPVAANLLVIGIVAAGLVIAPTVRQEIFPEIEMGMIVVTVAYPGATPEEVEQAVCIRIEEAIHDIEGVKRVTASAREGLGTVAAELVYGTDAREVHGDIEAAVDAIDTLPDGAREPVIRDLESFKNAISVAIRGVADERALKRLGERVRDELADLPEVTHVELVGTRPYEVSIEVSDRALRSHGLTFDDVVRAVQRSSLDLPGGALETDQGDILLRTTAQARRGPEFERLVLLTRADGTRLRLGDVARVVDGFADTREGARFDGEPAVLLEVFRAGDQRVLDVVDSVQRYVAEAGARLPPGATLDVWRDESVPLGARRRVMLENGAYGLVLVMLVLGLFLRPRLAFWVAMGIPISFLGAIAVMPVLDVSVNVISLVAFIVALGLVVDDAIVVGDAVARREEEGATPLEAAVRGARAVAVPVAVAALTTMVMFAPSLLVGGIGQQGHPLGLVVIACLSFSLLESLLVLPAHLSHGRLRHWHAGGIGRLREAATAGLERFVQRCYRPALRAALRNRGATLAAGFAALPITWGLVTGGWVPLRFLPEAESDYVTAALTLPAGTPAAELERHVRHIEAAAERLRAELDAAGAAPGGSVFRHVFTSIGRQPEKRRQSFMAPLSWNSYEGTHLAEVQIGLVPREERSVSTGEVADRWRALVGEIPEAVELTFPTALYATSDPINVQLAAPDADLLAAATRDLEAALARYPGVRDIASSGRGGKPELRLHVRPEAEALGISVADLARQVRQGFHGEEAQRAQRGRDDVPVVVRYPTAERRSLASLDDILIRTTGGAEVPFWTVARADLARGPTTLQRADRKRTLRVTADVDPEVASENAIAADLVERVMPRILADHPGVGYSLEGIQREQAEFLDTLGRGMVLGLIAVYGLLAVPLRSYLQPLLILLAVPFAWVGAFWGHGLLRMDVSMFTFIGIAGVTGVVVNDALVLLYAIREERCAGRELGAALERACSGRFRPILLTTVTTLVGLTPLLLERSTHAQDLKPMAVALGFGELLSTGVVLFVLPAAYAWVEERQFLRPAGSPASSYDDSRIQAVPNSPVSLNIRTGVQPAPSSEKRRISEAAAPVASITQGSARSSK